MMRAMGPTARVSAAKWWHEVLASRGQVEAGRHCMQVGTGWRVQGERTLEPATGIRHKMCIRNKFYTGCQPQQKSTKTIILVGYLSDID